MLEGRLVPQVEAVARQLQVQGRKGWALAAPGVCQYLSKLREWAVAHSELLPEREVGRAARRGQHQL